jgi:D-cysteine desulfhydrase family pyridoxal phosphate-dependent enzyme
VSDHTTALAELAAAPRVALGHWPTPLEPCRRLQDQVGGPLIWLKRDDCSGLALGGNKTRKLEFLLGRALTDGCDLLFTFGALQSNHARQTAAACARVGVECQLILTRAVARGDDHYLRSGNLLLDGLLGATVHVVEDPDEAFVLFAELHDAAVTSGRRPYVVGPGGSDPVGTLGYVAAGLELAGQVRDLGLDVDRVSVAASTSGTAAGLVLGCHMADWDVTVDAQCVYEDAATTGTTRAGLVDATAAALGASTAPADRWRLSDAALGAGYGVPTAAGTAAIELLARTEGVLLDPVYTAKAMGALLAQIAAGEVPAGSDVVFVHTGGAPGVFAYASEWDSLT